MIGISELARLLFYNELSSVRQDSRKFQLNVSSCIESIFDQFPLGLEDGGGPILDYVDVVNVTRIRQSTIQLNCSIWVLYENADSLGAPATLRFEHSYESGDSEVLLGVVDKRFASSFDSNLDLSAYSFDAPIWRFEYTFSIFDLMIENLKNELAMIENEFSDHAVDMVISRIVFNFFGKRASEILGALEPKFDEQVRERLNLHFREVKFWIPWRSSDSQLNKVVDQQLQNACSSLFDS